MKREIFNCDVCGKETDVKKKRMDVLFTTDQTEGRSCDTHLSQEDVELCGNCMAHVLKGNYIYGSGCQGYNKYWFKVNP